MTVTGENLRNEEIIQALIARDGDKCQYYLCKNPFVFTEKDFRTKDHVIPRSKGGEDKMENYVLMHFSCNSEKADRLYLPDGTLEPRPKKNDKIFVPKREPCETCMEGRLLLEDETCPTCGSEPQPKSFPKWAQLVPKECPHSGVWHCWACVLGVYDREPASSDVFGVLEEESNGNNFN